MIQKITADLSQVPSHFVDELHAQRVETGPLQINDDWPGFFLRGDATLYYVMCIENLINALEKGEQADAVYLMSLQNLLRSMRGSRISNVVDEDDSDVGC